MKKRILFLFIICSFSSNTIFSWSFWGPKKPIPNKDRLEKFQKLQIDKPLDPLINYNLGVALYIEKKYEQARENFKRVLDHSKDNIALIKRSYFNLGNCGYKNSLNMLGNNWETKDIKEDILHKAHGEITDAITNYKSYLVLEKDTEDRKSNLTLSEELLKKIEDKLRKEQQEKQDKKDKQDQNKDKQDQQEKSDDTKQDPNGNQEKSDDNKDSKDESGKDKDKEKENQDQKKHDEQKKEDQEKKKQEQEKKEQEEKKEEQQQNQGEGEEQSAQQEEVPVQDREMREMSAMLDNLDQQEKDTQKAFLKEQIKQAGKNQDNKKSW